MCFNLCSSTVYANVTFYANASFKNANTCEREGASVLLTHAAV